MYEIALTVAACLRSGTRVDVAWVVETDLAPAGDVPVDPSGALALTPGGGRVGSLYGGALDQQLAERAQALGERGRLVTVQVGDLEAQAFGLAGAGTATAVVAPAGLLPVELWSRLLERDPVTLVLARDGDELVAARLQDAEGHDAGCRVDETEVTTTWRPVPTVVLAGGGPVLQALQQMAPLLGWRDAPRQRPGHRPRPGRRAGPARLVVLAMHDVELAGPVLARALSTGRPATSPRSGAGRCSRAARPG